MGLKGDSQIVLLLWSFTRMDVLSKVISDRIRVVLRAHWALQDKLWCDDAGNDKEKRMKLFSNPELSL